MCICMFPTCLCNWNTNLSPIVFNKTLCETLRIDFKNSPIMEFFFFETEIWYACLGLCMDTIIIMVTKINQLYYILYKKIEGFKLEICKWARP